MGLYLNRAKLYVRDECRAIMRESVLNAVIAELESRYIEGAGFANRLGGANRPDATCWAVLSLQAAGYTGNMITKGRQSLVRAQHSDGRVCISPERRDVCWPTSLAILAWQGSPEHCQPQQKAIHFLLNFRDVRTSNRSKGWLVGHNGTIKGWPWIAGTYSWVEPTSYALLALRACGDTGHSRAKDAIRLLADRQLPSGGWNYGNTITFGQELHPLPAATGLSLDALSGLMPRANVEKSISYLRSQLGQLQTPMSLAWAILGLHAWRERVEDAEERLLHVLEKQPQDHPYDTVSLSLSLLATCCEDGLARSFERPVTQETK